MSIEVGKILGWNEGERDAIHVAIVPVTAGQNLRPGDKIGLRYDGYAFSDDRAESLIGVVDPYLDGLVRERQRFYMFLFPNSVSSLKHKWTHPDIPDDLGVKEEEDDYDSECRAMGCD